MSDPMTDPIDRLRLLHRRCPRPNCADLYSHCDQCGQGQHPYPCDVVAALDELEGAWVDEVTKALGLQKRSIGQMEDRMDALQSRIDAATVLIRQAMHQLHAIISVNGVETCRVCGSPFGTSIDTCPNCAPFRAWLAGDKEVRHE